MADYTTQYLPLNPDVLKLIAEAIKIFERVMFQQRNGDPLERYHYLPLKFFNSTEAQMASSKITEFGQRRAELGLGVWLQSREALRRAGSDPDNMFTKFPAAKLHADGEPDNVLKVHYDSFVPKEYRLFLEDVGKTHLHFFPMSSALVLSLKHFVQTYDVLEVIRVLPFSFDSRTNAYSDEDIAQLHSSLLLLARSVTSIILSRRPVRITVDGSVKKITIIVDGVVVKPSPAQTRGVVTLSLFRYDHWFSLQKFCKIALLNPKVDPQGDFDDALKFLKKYEPFGWDPDFGLRRIKGAVIESLVDKSVLRAYLSQK